MGNLSAFRAQTGLNVFRSPAVAEDRHPARFYGYLNNDRRDWSSPVFLFFAESEEAMLTLIRDTLIPAEDRETVSITRASMESYLNRGWVRFPTIEAIGGGE